MVSKECASGGESMGCGEALSSVRMVLKTGCLREREWGFVLELTPEILRSAHDDNVFLEMRRPGDEFGEIC
jgi:hypothetical protein